MGAKDPFCDEITLSGGIAQKSLLRRPELRWTAWARYANGPRRSNRRRTVRKRWPNTSSSLKRGGLARQGRKGDSCKSAQNQFRDVHEISLWNREYQKLATLRRTALP